MFKYIDTLLNKITMYKLVLYYLIGLVVVAIGFSAFGILPYNPLALLFSVLFITIISLATNIIFSWAFDAPTNTESVYITALILALIITPISAPGDAQFFSIAIWASIWAMASKYIFAIKRKHLFNPAAFAVALVALTINQSASWWVGTAFMMPFVFIGGFLLTRKILRWDMVLGFFAITAFTTLFSHISDPATFFTNFWRLIAQTPLLFFAFVMLTEPLTTPPKWWLRVIYGGMVGFLFSPFIHIGSIYSTPELALIVGNIFVYLVSPKQKLLLRLVNRIPIAQNTYDFIFESEEKLKFKAGQYLEWTLDNIKVDSRGNRRYFTISSSPTEENIAMGIKFYPEPSKFKSGLLDMKKSDVLVASQLAGEFVLPRNKNKKLAFIAGGIGITPFRSMIKYLADIGEKRDITLFYSNKSINDVAYHDVFKEAEKVGIKTVFVITDSTSPDYTGALDKDMIIREASDYKDRYFYISGPHGMVVGFKETLGKMDVPSSHIKTDFFPGFA